MDTSQHQDQQQAQQKANNIQTQIDDMQAKAESSSGEEKQGIMNKIEKLKQEKEGLMSNLKNWESKGKNLENEAEGFLGKM